MIDLLREGAAALFILSGAFFFVVGAIGINRMPEVFTRLHAASVSDTAGVSLILVGLMLLEGFSLVLAKLVFLFLLLLFAGPVATHAIARAALKAGARSVALEDGRDERPGDPPAAKRAKSPPRRGR
ncbi:monovalent cation/H(+) antiporter subunit G [Prosthecomicrobium pneumaticum]|uniref:Multicomponent Na+:H+ antiporter subunit G n=1 Tax=Prosthecomicrobium pneumaticum TaxID=81895 RepID=A0A7W9FJH9_9HYPH|nr:multicomponent Na+:H+ antiporter subunit G [Prosthecomicrobium pneumaticum]